MIAFPLITSGCLFHMLKRSATSQLCRKQPSDVDFNHLSQVGSLHYKKLIKIMQLAVLQHILKSFLTMNRLICLRKKNLLFPKNISKRQIIPGQLRESFTVLLCNLENLEKSENLIFDRKIRKKSGNFIILSKILEFENFKT